MNHLVSSLSCKYKWLVDNLKIFLATESINIAILQPSISYFVAVASDWSLKFNANKSIFLSFIRSSEACDDSIYCLDDLPILRSNSHRDLGVVVDSVLKFHTHISEVVARADGVASSLLKSTLCRSPGFMLSIFIAHIRPILEYVSPVWFTGYVGDLISLESVQRRWTKNIDGVCACLYAERLRRLNLFSARGRLWRADMLLCWRIFHHLSIIYIYVLSPRPP